MPGHNFRTCPTHAILLCDTSCLTTELTGFEHFCRYDNLCNSADGGTGQISKQEFSNAVMMNGTIANITVRAESVYFCSQDVQ